MRPNWILEQLNEILVYVDEIDPQTTGNYRKLAAIRETVWLIINDIKNEQEHSD